MLHRKEMCVMLCPSQVRVWLNKREPAICSPHLKLPPLPGCWEWGTAEISDEDPPQGENICCSGGIDTIRNQSINQQDVAFQRPALFSFRGLWEALFIIFKKVVITLWLCQRQIESWESCLVSISCESCLAAWCSIQGSAPQMMLQLFICQTPRSLCKNGVCQNETFLLQALRKHCLC